MGEMVSMFQRTIGRAVGEPWCMSFAQYCLIWPDKMCKGNRHLIVESEHCMTVFRETDVVCHIKEPMKGVIAIWNKTGTDSGHTGLVETYGHDQGDAYIITIEGNTSDDDKVVREGDGVFRKKRFYNKAKAKMQLMGFLNPWPRLE